MKLKTLNTTNLKGKTVLCRVAYDIGAVEENGELVVRDTTRITATLPTLKHLIAQGCKIVLLTWVKRPGGKVVEKYRTAPHAKALEQLIGRPVAHVRDCVGPEVDRAIAALKPGDLLMLENVRFYPEEEQNDPAFAEALCKGMDIVVFDAFAQAHRNCASTTGILSMLPSVAGFCMAAEIEAFERILTNPKRPLVALLGGAKVSDKVATLRFLLDRADLVLIGGALANTFLLGLKQPVGASLVEAAAVDAAQKSMDIPAVAAALADGAPRVDASHGWPALVKTKLVLPVDLVASPEARDGAPCSTVTLWEKGGTIASDWKYFDIGPKTIELYRSILSRAGTIFWNGPMGFFEVDQFGQGTRSIAEAVANAGAFSVIGGGDTETIVTRYGMDGRFGHVSTGGGVSLEILAGKELPVMKYLRSG